MPLSYEQALAAIKAAGGGAGKEPTTPTEGQTPQPQREGNDISQLFSQERIAASGGETGLEYGYQPTSNIQPVTPESTYTAMPNSDKLTPIEHWLYGKLPGFTQSTVGQALTKFGESWAGKALNVLDIGAEGLERTIGLAAQYSQVAGTDKEQDFWDNIKEAWYAGSMTYDVVNLPTFKRDENGVINGITVPTDLPGIAELTTARQKLVAGMPLEEVKQEYYTGLGALQLRAQLYDTYGHVVLDPINYIMPALKPIERLQVARNVTLATKFTDEAVDVLRGTIKAAEEAQDMSKLAEVARIAVKTTDVANLGKIAELEKAGDIAGLAKLAGDLSEANNITRWEKAVIALTGGDPYHYKTPKGAGGKIFDMFTKPFQLTPASRAHEYLSMVTDNVGSYIISKLDDPEQIVQAISRASRSATGVDFGHAFLTLEGRVTQGALVGFDVNANQLLNAWQGTTEARTMLQNVAQMALGSIDDAALDTVMNAITKGGSELDAIAKLVGTTSDDLIAIGKALEGAPYHGTLFKAALMNELYDHAARVGVSMFGVKSRGLIEKMSLAMKSAESLAFLRTNPAFLARNFMNNELTMIARGIFTRIGANETDNLLQKIGYIPGFFEPGRIRQGFSMIGEASKSAESLAKGTGVIYEALRGEGGWLDNIANTLSDVKLGKLDMGELAQRVEVSARSRATTYGYVENWRNVWKPGKGYAKTYDVVSTTTRQWLETNGKSEIIDALENKIASAMHEKDLDGILGADNLRANIMSAVSDATKKTGFDIEKSLPADFIPVIEKGLEEAMPQGRTAIQDFINRTRLQLQNRLDDLNEIEVSRIASEMEAALKVEGPKAIPKFAARYMDEFWEAHVAHAVRMEDLSIIGDDAMRTAAWKSFRLESDNYFTRVFDRLEAGMKGIKRGAKGDFDMPQGVLDDFKAWKGETRSFFKTRASEYDAFFEAKATGKTPAKSYADITVELDAKYAQLIASEDAHLKNIDNAIASLIQDPQLKQMFLKTRGTIAEARRLDKEALAKFFQEVRGKTAIQKEAEFKRMWQDRQKRWTAIQDLENRSSAALAGDQEAAQWASGLAGTEKTDILEHPLRQQLVSAEAGDVAQRIDLYASVPRSELPQQLSDYILSKAKELKETMPEMGILDDIIEGKGRDVASGAFKYKKQFLSELPEEELNKLTQTGEGVAQEAATVAGKPQNYMPDAESMGIFGKPVGTAEDQYYLHRGFQSLDALEQAAVEISEKAPLKASDLPEDVFNDLSKYVDMVKGNMADARYTSLRYGEWKADTALLNYNRRYNYDTWLGTMMPFEFWMTHSLGTWAIHSIDRPAMLSTYLRARKTLETMGAPNQKLPERLKGNIRVNLPFAPKWMGQFFVDPLRATLPFDQFLYPLEKWRTNQYTLEGQAERLLLNKIQNDEGDAAELQNALEMRQGSLWDMAMAEAEANNEDLKFDAWDFVSLMSSPHAPLVWAKEMLDGTPENIGPFMPLTRMSRGVSTALGMQDFPLFPHNIEAKVRKTIGLPAYDKWDEYRTARMLSNMAANGDISVFDMVNAMYTKEGDIYREATDKMNKEFAVGALGGILGIPVKAYPIGELKQRTLYDEFQKAYKAYDNGEVDALNKFFDKYPEYEARLLQYKDPEVMARDFVVDQLWNKYYSYTDLNRKEIRDQLGDEFQYAFINKDTRSYDSVDLPTMAMWLKLMGGDPPGTLGSKPTKPLELTPPEIAWRVGVFNDTRNTQFDGWYDMQKEYYSLTKGKARQSYLKTHPQLTQYWDWRRDWMMKNPDTIAYLTDLTKEGEAEKWQYGTAEAMQEAQANQPSLTWGEWQNALGANLSNLVMDNVFGGKPMSESVRIRLEDMAEQMGMSYERLMQLLEASLTQ